MRNLGFNLYIVHQFKLVKTLSIPDRNLFSCNQNCVVYYSAGKLNVIDLEVGQKEYQIEMELQTINFLPKGRILLVEDECFVCNDSL